MRRLRWPVLALSLPGAVLAQQFPPTPPAPAPLTPPQFPPFQQAQLANGLQIILVESHKQPVLSISLSMPAGSVYDPPGKEGLADMVAGLLTKGAGEKKADEIASTIEGVGGSFSAGAGQDFLSVQADLLRPNAELAFQLVADAASRPAFELTEMELLRRQTLSSLQAEQSDPSSIAARYFGKELYGEHPYGRRATPLSVAAIGQTDLTRFQRDRLRPTGSLLVVAGDITLAEVRQLAEQAFGKWTGRPTPLPPPKAPPARTRTELLLVHRPASVQSYLLVGHTTFPGTDTTYYAAALANRVLGGGSDSRLFLILREQKGWTYGAYSDLNRPKGLGFFQASAEVRTEVTDSALRELLSQLKRICREPVSAAELDAAKGAMVGSFPLGIQTANQVAAAVARAKLLGLPANYLQTFRARLAAVTPGRILSVAPRMIRPEADLIVVVGDGSRIYEKLKSIAPVRIINAEGRTLQPADLAAKPSALNLDMGRLLPYVDTLIVSAQGKAVGAQIISLETGPAGFSYRESTEIGTFVNQTTTVDLGTNGEMIRVTQNGKLQGQDTKLALSYSPGKIQGFSNVVTPQGPKTFVVDTVLPPGTVDDNAIQAILPALRWTRNAKWVFPVFSATQNKVRQLSLTVLGVESVPGRMGILETYRAELSGDNQSVTFFVTTSVPHRLVKITIGGTPFEFNTTH